MPPVMLLAEDIPLTDPLMVKVCAPKESFPVKLMLPETVGLEFREIPLPLFILRLFNADTLEGIIILEELPPKTKFEDEVVVRLEAVPAIPGPLKVRVLEPTASAPAVKVSVPVTVGEPLKLN